MRDFGSHALFNDVTRNPFVWGAVLLSIGLLLFAVYFPPLASVLSMAPPTPGQWLFILAMSVIPLVVIQILKQFAFLDPLTRNSRVKESELSGKE